MRIILIISCLLLTALQSHGQEVINDSHVKVAMRLIGDKLLRQTDDDTSRILPVMKEANRFKTSFESEFRFDTDELVNIVTEVVDQAELAEHYIVEMEERETNEVIYSFEVNSETRTDLIPCSGRLQPQAAYALYFTILDEPDPALLATNKSDQMWPAAVLLVLGMVLIGGFIYQRRKGQSNGIIHEQISIGNYVLNKRNMILSIGNEKTELSSKEVDLLWLLYSAQNEAIEREQILKIVWGDEGHYVGRTLDVFVSKLRKRLCKDENIKIINVRGYGYKLIC